MPEQPMDAAPPRRWWRWLILLLVAVPLLLAVLVPSILWFVAETPRGRAFVARQVSALTLESGLHFEVGRIDGSLLSAFTLQDVTVYDLDGAFAVIPVAHAQWQPMALLGGRIAFDSVDVPQARLLRIWRLNPGDPDAPLLPDINLRIGRIELARLELAEGVAGNADVVTALGRAEITDGQLLLDVQAGTASGDRLALLLDAAPDDDRFDLSADVRAPAGGLAARLGGLPQGVSAQASGAGTWSDWRGQLVADVLNPEGGSVRVAELAILADSGRFRLQGELTPAALLPESARSMVQPALGIDASAVQDGDRYSLEFTAASTALVVTGSGGVDLQASRLDDVVVNAAVRRPELVHPRLSGTGIRIGLTAGGPLRRPELAWTATADSIRFRGEDGEPMGVDHLAISGQLRLADAEQPLATDFVARIGRVSGLPEQTAEMLENPEISGTISLVDGAVQLTALDARTTQLAATGDGAMLADGRLTASLDVRVARYELPQLGAILAEARLNLARPPEGALTLDGRFTGRALDLTSEGVENFLGGLPEITGRFRVAGDGRILVDQTRLRSPKLNFANATASYDPAGGRFTLNAAGSSTDYGPVAIAASGTADAPRATVTLARPGFGIGLENVVAEITPVEEGFGIVTRGESSQGPLMARVRLHTGQDEPMAIVLERATLAGIEARGQLVQTAAGPFGGRILVDGRGLEMVFDLSARGEFQRIVGRLSAWNARLPLGPPLAIAEGQGQIEIVLLPDRPTIVGDFDLKNVRRGDLVISTATGRFDLAGADGRGSVKFSGKRGDGKAFAATAGVRSVPRGYAISFNGTVGINPLKLERPALLVRQEDGWWLRPARLVLPKGTVDVGGSWGRLREARLQLNAVDLATIDSFGGGLGLGGTVSGQVAVRMVANAPVPQGEVNLRIDKLTRASLTGVSAPVDMVLQGHSTGDGLALGGRILWRNNNLGRIVVRITPGAGEDMTARFLAGELAGGVRYNGPVEPLWALFAPEGQELKGAVAIGVDFAGTVADPRLSGVARGTALVYRNADWGTTISDIGFDGRFNGPYFHLQRLSARAGNGTITGQGQVNLSAGDARRMNIGLQFNRAKLADSDIAEATISGPLHLRGQGSEMAIDGQLKVDSARYLVAPVQSAEVPVLKVRRAGNFAPTATAPSLLSGIALNIDITSDDRIRIEGMGLDSYWRANVRVRGTAANPRMLGDATLSKGEFVFASSDFNITNGHVTFNGAPMESAINIQAQTRAQDVTAYVRIAGTAARPQISFSSTPSLPEDEILSRLLFGASVADLSVTEAVQLASAVAGLRSGLDTMGKIRRSVGVDRLRLVGDNTENGMGTGLAVGKRITKNLYAEVLTDSSGHTLTTLQWTLSRLWSLIAEVSSIGGASANARYQKDY